MGGELVGEELVWCEPVARKLSRALGARSLILGSYGIALSAASELNWRERFLRPKSESIIAANDPSTEWRYGRLPSASRHARFAMTDTLRKMPKGSMLADRSRNHQGREDDDNDDNNDNDRVIRPG